MLKESLYEQIVIVVEREELAQMLRAEQRFEIEKIEDRQSEIRFTLGRMTTLDEEIQPAQKGLNMGFFASNLAKVSVTSMAR